MAPQIEIVADPGTLARRVASWLVAQIDARNGEFRLVLSGGSTPKMLYQLLAESPWAEQMPWSRVRLLWGDERFVPPDHPDSNYRMVREALLSRVPIPPDNVHPIPTHGTPAAAAKEYQDVLRRLYGGDILDPRRPLFDAVLLGLGEDGHTASLFPGTAVLPERSHWVAPVIGAKPEPRITLTYPALNSSAAAAFLITGSNKHAMWERLKQGDPGIPASAIKPIGRLFFFVDEAAASGKDRS
jgi:6-phosphogluconolactonase